MPASDLVNLSGLMADAKCFALVREHRWRDGVRCPGCDSSIRHKIDLSLAIVTGERSGNAPSQRWAASVVPDAPLCNDSKAEQGGRMLMFKNPVSSISDFRAVLKR